MDNQPRNGKKVEISEELLMELLKEKESQPEPTTAQVVSEVAQRGCLIGFLGWFIHQTLEADTLPSFIPLVSFIMGMIFREVFSKK